jgi:hypothetical protein
MPERRMLDFRSLEEVVPEMERLLAGHTTVGQWTLGQILGHLAMSIRLTTRVRPKSPSGASSPAIRRNFFRGGRFPEGMEAPHPRLVPGPETDCQSAADALRNAIAQWDSAPGPFPDHPLLGSLSRDEWTRFHCMHCAHHLCFVIPA